MKNKLINFSISLLLISILGIILTVIFSLLSYYNVISNNVNDNVMLGISLLLFFLFGLIFGIKEKRKGLLNGLLLIGIYLIIAFTYKALSSGKEFSSIYIVISRCALLLLGSIIGVNVSS